MVQSFDTISFFTGEDENASIKNKFSVFSKLEWWHVGVAIAGVIVILTIITLIYFFF
jgi:hypothetical protein